MNKKHDSDSVMSQGIKSASTAVLKSSTVYNLIAFVIVALIVVVISSCSGYADHLTCLGVLVVLLTLGIGLVLKLPAQNHANGLPHPITWEEAVAKCSDMKDFKMVQVFASGTKHYLSFFNSIIGDNNLRNFTIEMLVRCPENDEGRRNIINSEMPNWEHLAKEHNITLKVRFYDFQYMIRGLCIDNNVAIVGFYIREDGITLGTDASVLLLKKGNPFADYFIRQFVRVHAQLMKSSREIL